MLHLVSMLKILMFKTLNTVHKQPVEISLLTLLINWCFLEFISISTDRECRLQKQKQKVQRIFIFYKKRKENEKKLKPVLIVFKKTSTRF